MTTIPAIQRGTVCNFIEADSLDHAIAIILEINDAHRTPEYIRQLLQTSAVWGLNTYIQHPDNPKGTFIPMYWEGQFG